MYGEMKTQSSDESYVKAWYESNEMKKLRLTKLNRENKAKNCRRETG